MSRQEPTHPAFLSSSHLATMVRHLLPPQLVGLALLVLLTIANTATLAFAPGRHNALQCPFSVAAVGRKSLSPSTPPTSSTRRSMLTELIINADVVSSTTSPTASLSSTFSLLSFSDQGQNLAGIFFQASLLPYLTFLYFLSFRGNRTPALGNFGFQYLLLFVLGTIPSGIITKSVYGLSLANVDWLHGGAEALLTMTNVLIVSEFMMCFITCVIVLYHLSPTVHAENYAHSEKNQ